MGIILTYSEIHNKNHLRNLTNHILRKSREFVGFDNECFVLANDSHSSTTSDLKHCVITFEVEGTDKEILPNITIISVELVNYLKAETASLVWGDQPNGANIYPTLHLIINENESKINGEENVIKILSDLIDKWL